MTAFMVGDAAYPGLKCALNIAYCHGLPMWGWPCRGADRVREGKWLTLEGASVRGSSPLRVVFTSSTPSPCENLLRQQMECMSHPLSLQFHACTYG